MKQKVNLSNADRVVRFIVGGAALGFGLPARLHGLGERTSPCLGGLKILGGGPELH